MFYEYVYSQNGSWCASGVACERFLVCERARLLHGGRRTPTAPTLALLCRVRPGVGVVGAAGHEEDLCAQGDVFKDAPRVRDQVGYM